MTDEKKEELEVEQVEPEDPYDFATQEPALFEDQQEPTEEPDETLEAEPDETPDETEEEAVETMAALEDVGKTIEQVEQVVEPEKLTIPYRASGEDRTFEYELEDGKLSADTIAKLSQTLAMEGLQEKVQKVQEDKRTLTEEWQGRFSEQSNIIADYKARLDAAEPLLEAMQRNPQIAQGINRQYAQQMGGRQVKQYDPNAVRLQQMEVQMQQQQFSQEVGNIVRDREAAFKTNHPELSDVEVTEVIDAIDGNIDRIPMDVNGVPTVPIETMRASLMESPEISYGKLLAAGKFKKTEADPKKLEQKLRIAKAKAGKKNPSAGGNGAMKVTTPQEKGWHEIAPESDEYYEKIRGRLDAFDEQRKR